MKQRITTNAVLQMTRIDAQRKQLERQAALLDAATGIFEDFLSLAMTGPLAGRVARWLNAARGK